MEFSPICLQSTALQFPKQLAGVERFVAQHMADRTAHELFRLLLRDRVGKITGSHIQQRLSAQL